MTEIKICGLTREEDVDAAVAMGATMLGFIHVPDTPRFSDIARLKELLPRAAGKAKTVLVVQDLPDTQLDRLRSELNFDLFQFHGQEPEGHLARWKGYKVIHMRGGAPDPGELARYGTPFLLDTQVRGQKGGTGKTFDWTILPDVEGDFLVAGGLTHENVAQLITQYQPWGVDVSSGVEASPGQKDHTKLQQFITNARRASAA